VGKYILDAVETKPIDLTTYIVNFESQLPKVRGSKAYAISGIVRDIPEDLHCSETNAFVGYPRRGVSTVNDIDP
jgi:hypothetical protein